jgi:hypothetical protein
VSFSNVGSLTNVSINTNYYVLAASLTATTFQIAATPGGAALTLGSTVGGATLYPVTILYSMLKGNA